MTLEEIETIISEAKPTNTKSATACGVLYYNFVFLLVKFNDFNTAIEMHINIIKRLQHSLFVCYRDLQALVYKQDTRNLKLHLAAPRAVLNFSFLVCKRVLVNTDSALEECCNP